MKNRLAALCALVLFLALSGCRFFQRGPKLADTDSIVLLDFANSTGDAAFDGALGEALAVGLGQSPWLNIISPEKVDQALRALGYSGAGALPQDVAQKVCTQTGAKAFLSGKISKDGDKFPVVLRAVQCAGGETVAEAEAETASRSEVVHALGLAAADLRRELGESPATIAKFNLPLEKATSSSLEALQAYSQGRQISREKGALESIPPFKKAAESDPRFALAHSNLAVAYYNLNQNALASEEIRQAFELGDRQTERDRLHVKTLYYDLGPGDVEKAIASYKEWVQLYPHDDAALGNLSSEYFLVGQYEEAASTAAGALRLDPGSAAWYENSSTALIALLRLDEAQTVLNQALDRKIDDLAIHSDLYSLAFLRSDSAAMNREVAWAGNRSGFEDTFLGLQADTEAYAGHLKKARELSRRAVESAKQAQLVEPAAIWQGLSALREAFFGFPAEARQQAGEIVKLAPDSRDAQMLAAIGLAAANDAAGAQKLLDDLRARYVSNTIVQQVWFPTVQAQFELLRSNPAKAIQILEPVRPFDRGQLIGNLSSACLIPAYLRGQAFLAAKQGAQALAEFEKIQDSRGVVVNCWAGPLSRLGQARAQALSGLSGAARSSYQGFFDLWKDADSDIPVLKAARAEFTKLK